MKLERKHLKVFGSKAEADMIGQFGSALDGTKKNTSDIEEIQALSAWEGGWGSAAIGENRYPSIQEVTGLHKVLSYETAYILQEGVPTWHTSTEYSATSIVKAISGNNVKLYRSKQDGNIGHALQQTDWWEEVSFINNKITNCILEAPNGIATTSGNTITVKRGLKFLIANGLTNNIIIQNLEKTLQEDITTTIQPNTSDGFHIFYIYSDDGVNFNIGRRSYWSQYFEQYSEPQKNDYTWFDMANYVWKNKNNGVASSKYYVLPLGTGNIDRTTGNIIGFSLIKTPEVITGNNLSSYVSFKNVEKKVYQGNGLTSKRFFDLSDSLPKQPVLAFFSASFNCTNNGGSSLVGGSNLSPYDMSICTTNNFFTCAGNIVIPTNDAKVYFWNKTYSGGVAGLNIALYGYMKIQTRG